MALPPELVTFFIIGSTYYLELLYVEHIILPYIIIVKTYYLIARVQKTIPGMKKMITSSLSRGAADMGLCRREH